MAALGRMMIDWAAMLCGQPRADFVRDATVRAADEAPVNDRLIHMSPEGFADFTEILSVSAAPVIQMAELIKRPAPWEPGYVAKQ